MPDSLKFLKGMIKDTGRMDQPDGTYRDALNLIIDDQKLNVGNEYGTETIGDLTCIVPRWDGAVETCKLTPIGQIALLDDSLIIFGRGSVRVFTPVGPRYVFVSAILKISPDSKVVKPLFVSTNIDLTQGAPNTVPPNPRGYLNFDENHPVTGEFRVAASGDTFIYFTDNKYSFKTDPDTGIEYIDEYNPPRVFNISKQERFVDIDLNNTYNIYGLSSNGVFMLNIFMETPIMPELIALGVVEGGGLETGAYYIALAYADDDLTESNIVSVSLPVYIVPLSEDTAPTGMISGAPAGTQTKKSISCKINVSSITYKYVVPYVIKYSGNARFVYKLDPMDISNGVVYFTYTGLEAAAQSSIEETIIDKVRYLTAKSITQLDNKLYMANLTARKDLGYQRFANRIRITTDTLEVTQFDPRRYDIFNLNEGYAQLIYPDNENTGWSTITTGATGVRGLNGTAPYMYQATREGKLDSYINNIIAPIERNKGYRNAEFASLYKGYRRGEVYAFYISFVLKDGSESFAYHIPGRRSSGRYEVDFSDRVWEGQNSRSPLFKGNEVRTYYPLAQPFHLLDTSLPMSGVDSFGNIVGIAGASTGYWNNKTELYPNTDDFDVWEVDANGNSYIASSVRSEGVRHHKMPSNHNPSYSHVYRDTDFSTPSLDNYTTSSRDFNEVVRILGIKVSEIPIPKFILKQVQGYKIYYAKRTQSNKTILGQSGAHPATPYLAANLNNTRKKAKTGPFYNIWLMEGHHKTGGLHNSTAGWTPSGVSYLSQPVIKFHDFNLLRKKHDVATATHVDVQYIVTMQNWRGGYKGAKKSTVTGISSDYKFYTSFRSDSGDDEYAWVHPDLGNTIDFNYPATSTTPSLRDIYGPNILWGNVFIGAKYNSPGRVGVDVGALGSDDAFPSTITPEDVNQGVPYGTPIEGKQENLLSTYQTIFMLEAEGATYIDGLSILKTISGAAFKGATYLYNSSGESGIVLGLASGLPALGGYVNSRWSYHGLANYLWKTANFIPGTAYPLVGLIDIDAIARASTSVLLKFTDAMTLGHENLIQDTTADAGRPNVYLINLCSLKMDVFAPFDQQQLVWTGYYHFIGNADLETGVGEDGQTYYGDLKNTTDTIFGGDTYICRYGYRTTSQSYGLARLRRGPNDQFPSGTNQDYIWGDVPFDQEQGLSGNFGGAEPYHVLYFGTSTNIANTLNDEENFTIGDVNPFTTVYQFLVESDDNINFRHAGDQAAGVAERSSLFFDKYTASEILFKSPLTDFTKMDNILYEDHYSALQDIRVTIPYPKRNVSAALFPSRVIKSATQEGSFKDTYRYFYGAEYKDFAVNRGPITNIFALKALLFIHTEKSLFRTKGKQTMELSDKTQAYIGSGNLFAQEPDEFVQSSEGFIGLVDKLGSLVTKDGYVFVSRKSKRIFLVEDKVTDLTEMGITAWARENIPFVLETYGLNLDNPGDFIYDSNAIDTIVSNAPTNNFGFLVSYDPLFKRTLITKRELVPTQAFIDLFKSGGIIYDNAANGFKATVAIPEYGVGAGDTIDIKYDADFFERGGWTISFSHGMSAWASRHSYVPPLYAFTSKYLYSFNSIDIVDFPNQISTFYEHSDIGNPGNFYGTTYNFEIDCIFLGETVKTAQGVRSLRDVNKIFSNVSYTIDTFTKFNVSSPVTQQFSPGFTSYFVYNTTQVSGETDIYYLDNIRKIGNEWNLNDFRDLSAFTYNTSLKAGQLNVRGEEYLGTYTNPSTEEMFLSEGVINSSYIDPSKPWYEKKKFVDKFLGVRLIANNKSKNLINLYGVTAASRISPR